MSIAEDGPIARAPKKKRANWLLRLFLLGFVVAVVGPVLWVLLYGWVGIPGTHLMGERRGAGVDVVRKAVAYERMSPHLARAVIAAEDAQFCMHDGFDREAIEAALEYNKRQEARGSKKRRGASTISQQTAKNVFLWADRSWVRKGFEVYFTVLIETLWSKERIMEAYLNVAEWGEGAFGAEAAAQKRFNKSAKDLTQAEAARLAAILPSPNRWRFNGSFVTSRTRAIQARMRVVASEGLDFCVTGKARPPAPAKTPGQVRPLPEPLPPIPAPPPELEPPLDAPPPLELPTVDAPGNDTQIAPPDTLSAPSGEADGGVAPPSADQGAAGAESAPAPAPAAPEAAPTDPSG